MLFFGVVLIAEGCKNNDEVFPVVQSTFVNIINASADTLNFYLNGTRQNDQSSIFPTGQSTYLTINSGAENLQFKQAGAFKTLFSFPITLTDSTYYSFFVAGANPSDCFNITDAPVSDTSANSEEIRFVNASPDAGTLTVSLDSITYSNSSFKSATQFAIYGSGPKEIKVFRNGSTSANIDTTVIFQPGYIYTVFSKGLLNGKGNSVFDVGVITNGSL